MSFGVLGEPLSDHLEPPAWYDRDDDEDFEEIEEEIEEENNE